MRRAWAIAIGIGLAASVGTAHARGWRKTAAELGTALRSELGLATTATELHEGVKALEREQLGIDYDAAILDHAGRESMRRLDAYRQGRADREDRAQARARTMYKLARGGLLRIALEDFGTDEETDTAERVATGRSLRWLVQHDLKELSVYQRAEARAESELLAASRELQALSALATVQTMQSQALDEARAIVRPELRKARRHRKRITRSDRTDERALKAQRELQRAVKEQWRTLSKLEGLGRDAALVRPVAGKVVGEFGEYEDPIYELTMVRHGAELAARPDEAVYVMAPGKVVLVSRLPGFDDVVVVDHGQGELSMTGRLWKVEVAEGDELEEGDILGHAAPKAIDDGLGRTVYVEIRQADSPIDPAPYLRRAKKFRG